MRIRALPLAFLLVPVLAAQPVFEPLTRAQGLPSDYVQALYQDRAGFVWLGTDAGLARYDGARVETFTTDEGLPHSMVYGVAEDGAGTLYAATFTGLARFDGSRFHAVPLPFRRQEASMVFADARGRLVVVGGGGEVARREGLRWRLWQDPAPGFRRAVALPDGRLLVNGSARAAPTVLEDVGATSFRARPLRMPAAWGHVLYVLPSLGGTVLVHGEAFLYRAFLRGNRLIARDSFVNAGYRPAFAYGADVYASMGSGGDGLFRLRLGAAAERVYTPFADAYLTDYEGSLWIGTFGGGAARLRATHLRTLTTAPAVRLARDAEGTVWATGEGLWRVRAGATAAEHFRVGQVLRAVAPVRGGLVVSGNAAAYRVTSADLARRAVGPPLAYHPSWISALDAATDTLYVATYGGGVERIVRGRPRDTLRAGHGLPTDLVEELVRTRSGLWFVTRTHGALRLRGGRAEAYATAQGLPSSTVFSVGETPGGTLYFGTDRGVGRLRAGAARAEALGTALLRGQRVTAVFERAATPGLAYAVGDRVLYRIDPAGAVRPVGAGALLPDPAASINAALYDPPTDRLFLATTRGLVVANLAALPARPLPAPRVAVTGVYVDEQPVGLDGAGPEHRLPDLSAGRHRLEVAFAPLSFVGGTRAEYRIGRGTWQSAGAERRVVFPNVGAGPYRLEVRAVNADGVPSVQPAVVVFSVPPLLWQRPGFWVLVVLVGLGLTAAAVRYTAQRRLRARVRRLEADGRVQAMRERLSRDLHDHIGGQLATLVSAADLAGLAAARGDTARALGVAASLADEARQALGQLRQTVRALQHDALSATDLFRQVRAQAEGQLRYAERPLLDARLDGDAADRVLVEAGVGLQVLRVAQEAVTNALRHADAQTLRLTLQAHGGRLVLLVEDDGVGLAAPKPGDGASAPGFGLANMRARAAEVGGVCVVEAAAPGTRVRLDVPLADA